MPLVEKFNHFALQKFNNHGHWMKIKIQAICNRHRKNCYPAIRHPLYRCNQWPTECGLCCFWSPNSNHMNLDNFSDWIHQLKCKQDFSINSRLQRPTTSEGEWPTYTFSRETVDMVLTWNYCVMLLQGHLVSSPWIWIIVLYEYKDSLLITKHIGPLSWSSWSAFVRTIERISL